MTFAAGALTQVSVTQSTANLSSAVATGGTSPYTYQWYRDTSAGFSPGGGNILSGKTALTLADTGLVPNTVYYYKVVATDVGNSNATATSSQLAVTTAQPTLSQNQFAQTSYIGVVDLRFAYNTVSVQIDTTQSTPVYPGTPVKMVDSAGGIPKVIACDADSDVCLGFLNFDIKSTQYAAGDRAEMSMSGNCIFLYATAAIARGAQVRLDIAGNGVKAVGGSSGATVVGWAYDKATSPGDLIRVFLRSPTFTVDS